MSTPARSAADRRLRILSAGPDWKGRGGIATVEQQIAAHAGHIASVTSVSTHVEGTALRRVRAAGGGLLRVAGYLLARRVDVLHLHVAKRGSVFRKGLLTYLATLLRVPVVLHCHGGVFAEDFAKMPRPVQRLVSGYFRRARRVVVLGEHWLSVYTDLVGVPHERVVIVHNGVDVPSQVPGRAAEPVQVVYLGKIVADKGAFDLVDAVAELPAEVRSRIRVVLAGHGEVDHARRIVDELGLTEVVEVPGWLDPEQRDPLLARSSVFALPSYFEGLPMALLEAMAWGLVPVVTPVGAIPEVVTDGGNGMLVEPGDVAGLAKALRRLVEEPALLPRLAAQARRTGEQHDVDAFVGRLGAVWQEAVADVPAARE